MGTESRLWLPEGGGRGGLELTANWYRVSFGGDDSVLKLGSGDCYTVLNILITTELSVLSR